MSRNTIWTIGYERTPFGLFLTKLQDKGVRLVIDIRNLPLSRRAGFSKRVLAASLASAGIDYVHLKGLGTPKEGRLAARRGDYESFWSIVEQRMLTEQAALDLDRAAELARRTPSALLCFEADPEKCHRRRVADDLAAHHGFSIEHIRASFFE